MRAREFIFEDSGSPAANNLLDALESIRNRFRSTGQDPKIRVDSLVSMVRGRPGSEMFNVDSLKNLYDKNNAVKNLIASISDDDSGNKYIYLKPTVTDLDSIDTSIDTDSGTAAPDGRDQSVSTVDKMAKRAAARRS
jgi:hypothetical protein